MFKNKQGFSTILIVVIVLVVIAGCVLVWTFLQEPTPLSEPVVYPDLEDGQEVDKPVIGDETDETADWQTYRNEESGFEIKYPVNWYMAGKFSDECALGMLGCIERIVIGNKEEASVTSYLVDISYFDVTVILYEHDYARQQEQTDSLKKSISPPWSVMKFGDIEVLILNSSDWSGSNNKRMQFVRGNKIYRFNYGSGSEDQFSEDIGILKMMVSTFRFID